MAESSFHQQSVRGVVTSTDPERARKRALAARGAVVTLAIGVLALAVQSLASGWSTWGYFHTPDPGAESERGYFGPWRVCKYMLYGRERCGQNASRFRPVGTVWIAGLAAVAASILLAVLVVLAVLQLAMASSAKRVVVSYSAALIGKAALATLTTCLAILAACLFATQTDDRDNSFYISRGLGFYLQLASIAFNFGVLVSAVYEGIYARRGGDPTRIRNAADPRGTTINNPGYREHRHPSNGASISMTDASGKPYASGARNGSMASVATSGSVTSTASPLRSSLKKPKPLGIQNPGFSSHSPTLTRNGSQKKVRIQTHSTEV